MEFFSTKSTYKTHVTVYLQDFYCTLEFVHAQEEFHVEVLEVHIHLTQDNA